MHRSRWLFALLATVLCAFVLLTVCDRGAGTDGGTEQPSPDAGADVASPSLQPTVDAGTPSEGLSKPIAMSAPAAARERLRRVHVTGTVLGVTGAGVVAEVRVSTRRWESQVGGQGWSSSDGEFNLDLQIPSDTTSLTLCAEAASEGVVQRSYDVRAPISESGAARALLLLRPGGTIVGKLSGGSKEATDRPGKVIICQLGIGAEEGPFGWNELGCDDLEETIAVALDGSFRAIVRPGATSVTPCDSTGRMGRSVLLDVKAGHVVDVGTLRLPTGDFDVEILVRAGVGDPVPGAAVWIDDLQVRNATHARWKPDVDGMLACDSSGVLRLSGMSTDRLPIRLAITASGYDIQSALIRGDTRTVEVRLADRRPLRFRIRGPGGVDVSPAFLDAIAVHVRQRGEVAKVRNAVPLPEEVVDVVCGRPSARRDSDTSGYLLVDQPKFRGVFDVYFLIGGVPIGEALGLDLTGSEPREPVDVEVRGGEVLQLSLSFGSGLLPDQVRQMASVEMLPADRRAEPLLTVPLSVFVDAGERSAPVLVPPTAAAIRLRVRNRCLFPVSDLLRELSGEGQIELRVQPLPTATGLLVRVVDGRGRPVGEGWPVLVIPREESSECQPTGIGMMTGQDGVCRTLVRGGARYEVRSPRSTIVPFAQKMVEVPAGGELVVELPITSK